MGNMRDLVDLLPRLNLTGDEALETMRKKRSRIGCAWSNPTNCADDDLRKRRPRMRESRGDAGIHGCPARVLRVTPMIYVSMWSDNAAQCGSGAPCGWLSVRLAAAFSARSHHGASGSWRDLGCGWHSRRSDVCRDKGDQGRPSTARFTPPRCGPTLNRDGAAAAASMKPRRQNGPHFGGEREKVNPLGAPGISRPAQAEATRRRATGSVTALAKAQKRQAAAEKAVAELLSAGFRATAAARAPRRNRAGTVAAKSARRNADVWKAARRTLAAAAKVAKSDDTDVLPLRQSVGKPAHLWMVVHMPEEQCLIWDNRRLHDGRWRDRMEPSKPSPRNTDRVLEAAE